ncbi:MAG: aspartate--tRNA ligase [Candidatus Raymondbacteria bacterium RifOxyA12_full_50_37]|nr:MAG: aspartate--tRNA ligase [Candidatus Raymondbacteria bacterium RifOxyA12_full_50_37]OGJ92215.1 MAG: aspartate--tRNA ligase [Candidatus Raymondbacteria bacterium RIFOXYA2_FULL_49_16]OGJ98541.1 MAG: aspartate--tRNA ligase [Candidatus Raymondbacteria bacterium RIFOXYC2_FULL_50_21]OGP44210.1 MAG: aspartate--tRNA ligase [Candidatus Raymondbacteria bacterium RIFOXYB2_FULL_49_35]
MQTQKMLRTHTCGELTATHNSQSATLAGWVHTRRDHGGVHFIHIRDRFGMTQVVFEPSHDQTAYELADNLRREWVIQITGIVRMRSSDQVNQKLSTGEIELVAHSLKILNKSDVPPFTLDEWSEPTESVRFKYRYLDLRRAEMQRNFQIRHKAAQAARAHLSEEGFLEIETPMLVRSTPEGARDFLVPSRLNPGTCYSLPQSPQLYKQLLMVSGMDRYFQIARCMRDEDLRSDRQPEFTQIDIEASFITEEFIYGLVERLMQRIFRDAIGFEIAAPFARLTFAHAMEKYGCDKPDLRYGLELADVTDIVKESDFTVFKSVVAKGGMVKCINPEGTLTKGDLETYIEFAKQNGAQGMAWMKVTEAGLESNIVKYFSPDIQKRLIERTGAKPGSTLMYIADRPKVVNEVLSRLRADLARKLNLINTKVFSFAWVTDFPLFEYDEKEKRIGAAHHIFTMPKAEHIDLLETDPLKVLAQCYDLVLNGIEIASGSIRIHDPEIQKRVMKVIGVTAEQAEKRFGFLLEAFRYGAPPHGGIAPGFDRIVALMSGYNDIREVIAFPKTASGTSLLDGCPTPAEAEQLRELHMKFVVQ